MAILAVIIIPERSGSTERGPVSTEESRHQKQNIGQRTRSRPQAEKLKFKARLQAPVEKRETKELEYLLEAEVGG